MVIESPFRAAGLSLLPGILLATRVCSTVAVAQDCTDLARVMARETQRKGDASQVDIQNKTSLCSSDVESATAEQRVTLQISGQGKLALSTKDGRLSGDATVGKTSNYTLVVSNDGTAPLEDVEMSGTVPTNWKVEFNPKNIASLAAGDKKEVEAVVTPSDKAIAGDYVASFRAGARGDDQRQQPQDIDRGEQGVQRGDAHLGKDHAAEGVAQGGRAPGHGNCKRSRLAAGERGTECDHRTDDHADDDVKEHRAEDGAGVLQQGGVLAQPLGG